MDLKSDAAWLHYGTEVVDNHCRLPARECEKTIGMTFLWSVILVDGVVYTDDAGSILLI